MEQKGLSREEYYQMNINVQIELATAAARPESGAGKVHFSIINRDL